MALVVYSTNAFANDKPRPNNRDNDNNHFNRVYNPDKQLSQSTCGDHLGRPIIDVNENVRNDVDSGYAGWWAFDYYTRHIQVWQTIAPTEEGGKGTYCAIVTYNGQFYAVPGQPGPGDADSSGPKIDSPVNGPMSGGYRAIITATFAPIVGTGAWPTHGNVGTYDYQCNISGDSSCTLTDWVAKYFPSYNYPADFSQPWWGWQYKGGSHGTWVNAIDVPQASSGNIL